MNLNRTMNRIRASDIALGRALIRDLKQSSVKALVKWLPLVRRLTLGSIRYRWEMKKVDRMLAKFSARVIKRPFPQYVIQFPPEIRSHIIRRCQARVSTGLSVWPPTSFETRYIPKRKAKKRKVK